MTDQRSANALTWRSWYRSPNWQRLRKAQLRAEPLCRMCASEGRVKAAGVVDHIEQHKGDEGRFWNPHNLQSLCSDCHDKHKQRMEVRGYSDRIGEDGWPTDVRHPANKGRL